MKISPPGQDTGMERSGRGTQLAAAHVSTRNRQWGARSKPTRAYRAGHAGGASGVCSPQPPGHACQARCAATAHPVCAPPAKRMAPPPLLRASAQQLLAASAPTSETEVYAESHDSAIRQCLQHLLGDADLARDPRQLAARRAQLPLRFGGLGLRSAAASRFAAYWASWADSMPVIGGHPGADARRAGQPSRQPFRAGLRG